MSKPTKSLYENLLATRAQRLGGSREEAEKVDWVTPLYLKAAETAARRLGTTQEAVLQEDLKRMETSDYPTPECLTPDEVEELILSGEASLNIAPSSPEPRADGFVAAIPENRRAHLATCVGCQTLMFACQPSESRRQQFRIQLRQELERRKAAPSAEADHAAQAAAHEATASRVGTA
jgi:hypothetical protein